MSTATSHGYIIISLVCYDFDNVLVMGGILSFHNQYGI